MANLVDKQAPAVYSLYTIPQHNSYFTDNGHSSIVISCVMARHDDHMVHA